MTRSVEVTGQLQWLNELAKTLPEERQKQLAEILDLAACGLGEGFHAEVRMADLRAALEGLPITAVTP